MNPALQPNPRDEILALLHGQRAVHPPSFSGLIHVAAAGLQAAGIRFAEVHADPATMASAAATTFRQCGIASAAVPLDLCVEAEALGAVVDFHRLAPQPHYPSIARPAAASADDWTIPVGSGLVCRGRVPVVLEAIRLLKEAVGDRAVVGAWLPGPFTLAMQILDMGRLLGDALADPDAVGRVLDLLADLLVEAGQAYRAAGADFLTLHEMGGSPGVLGPKTFGRLVLPRLKRIFAALPAPRVLSACGRTNPAMGLLAQCGADALSVDQANDLARSREVLGPEVLLFGNVDPAGVLAAGDEATVRGVVRRAIDAGADAVWPGCDLPLGVPLANLHAMADEMTERRVTPSHRSGL